MTHPVHFMLNDRVLIAEDHPGLLALDFLRQRQRLTGTKEGCKEGDCGACSVLIGELDASGALHYKPVTSCLVPLGELHGKHLVTVEGLSLPRPRLNPVQQAMTDHAGTQCGYCTPGFIVSMCWYMLGSQHEQPSLEGFMEAISGNLCRCTGYASIKRASHELVERFGPEGEFGEVWSAPDRVVSLVERELLPSYFTRVADTLASIPPAPEPEHAVEMNLADYVIAGGTDLYVQRGEHLPESRVHILNKKLQTPLKGVERVNGHLHIGALTTFEELSHDPHILALIPEIQRYMFLIASLQIRNRATISGNLVNASPIGDVTILMLALDARITLKHDTSERTLALKDLYQGYKQLDKHPSELLTSLTIPAPTPRSVINFEKVSKRKCLDIATVNSAAHLRLDDQGCFEHASISVGGVAAIPLHLTKTSASLIGQPADLDTARRALELAQQEISPISDVRGSADYKRLLTRQLLIAHLHKAAPDAISLAQLLE